MDLDGFSIVNSGEISKGLENLLENDFMVNLEFNLSRIKYGQVVDVGNLDKDSAMALRDIYSDKFKIYSCEDSNNPGKYALGFELRGKRKDA